MDQMEREGKPFILAHWHGDEVALLSMITRYKLATISSQSKDGEMMNTIIHLLGGSSVRGSSTRGGIQALKGIIRLSRQGRNCSIAVDGPKGPYHVVKPGVFELSRLAAVPIFYSAVTCDRCWVFHKAWNKAFLPKFFAKVYISWAGPIGPIQNTEDPKSKDLSGSLAAALHSSKDSLVKKIAGSPAVC